MATEGDNRLTRDTEKSLVICLSRISRMISLALDQLIASSAFGGAGEFTRGSGRSGAGNPYRSGVLESIFEALDSSGASCLR